MDLLLSENQVAVMREKGVVRTIYSRVKELVDDAVFDGENFWIASSRSGVFCVSPDGETIAHVDARIATGSIAVVAGTAPLST